MISKNDSGEMSKSHPRIGDVTICCECGEFCEFGPRDTLLKITDEEKLDSLKDHPEAQLAKLMATMVMKKDKDDTLGKEYGEEVQRMAKDVREWTRENPTRSPMLQRNSTSKVGIIGTLADAIEHKFVSVNDDAMMMLTELGWLERKGKRMPTIFMTEAAIEWAFKDSVD